MGLIVQKYGGTSVGSLKRIRNVARRVAGTFDQGNGLVVIVSAMAGETDGLLDLAGRIRGRYSKRELDVLLTTGEQKTAPLLAMTLQSMGYEAQSLLGHQIRVHTDSCFGRARIKDIDSERMKKIVEKKTIVVVAGFQGIDGNENVTTLGRGGSDTSAVAIAAAVDADLCEIYTDVEGVFTADPRICEKAQKLPKISYDEMLEMASVGSKVLHTRSVEFAKKYNIKVHVRSSFNDKEGTMVVHEDADMEKLVVSGVTCNKNEAQITIKRVSDQPGVAAKIFSPISEAGVSVDMIVQNNNDDGRTDMTFTVPVNDYKKALELSKKIAKDIDAEGAEGVLDVAKISVTGVGMKSHSGVASKMFAALAKEHINIIMISTSEIRISCIIEQKYAELAVRALHNAFELDSDQRNVSIFYR